MPSDAARQQYEKGVALFRNGDPDGSIHALKRAIELNPRFTEAYHVLGLVYFKGKRDALHAVESLNQAHQLDPDSARILNDLADVYIAQGKSQEAEQVLRKAIEAAPAGKEAYLDLARLYETRQDRAAAARIYQMLLRMHPDQTDALYNLASLYDRQGDVHGAAAGQVPGVAERRLDREPGGQRTARGGDELVAEAVTAMITMHGGVAL